MDILRPRILRVYYVVGYDKILREIQSGSLSFLVLVVDSGRKQAAFFSGVGFQEPLKPDFSVPEHELIIGSDHLTLLLDIRSLPLGPLFVYVFLHILLSFLLLQRVDSNIFVLF